MFEEPLPDVNEPVSMQLLKLSNAYGELHSYSAFLMLAQRAVASHAEEVNDQVLSGMELSASALLCRSSEIAELINHMQMEAKNARAGFDMN